MAENHFEDFSFDTQLDLQDSIHLGALISAARRDVYDDNGKNKFYSRMGEMYQILNLSTFESKVEQDIVRLVNQWKDDNGEIKNIDYSPQELDALAQDWLSQLYNETDSETRLPIGNQGFFDVEKAIEHPEKLFSPKIWGSMPDRTKNDIRESCRSLAVNCPTASTFLALRAVEDRLRFWYEREEGERIEEEAWGSVLGKMEELFDDGKKPPVLSNLEFLKSKRNDVSHPDDSPNMSEAETTLQRVRATITEIYEEVELEDDQPSLNESGLEGMAKAFAENLEDSNIEINDGELDNDN